VVYNKDKPDKRKVAFITEIAGYRSLAEKATNYRPSENDNDEVIETSDEAKHVGTNPHGIVSATYYAYKQDNKGEWHRVRGKVYWDEYVPLKEIWKNNELTGDYCPLSKTSNWHKMGRHMLMKCAEAHALRKGWPDQIPGDVYTREEMDQAEARQAYDMDLTASEVVEQQDMAERKALVGGPSITLLWEPGKPMEGVPIGQVADRCFQFIDEQTDPDQLRAWQETNAVGLRQYWAEQKHDALAVKKALSKRIETLSKENAA
ncbi:MAG: recombinase RecT, partial [Geminicoccaceae bacterium]